MGRIGDERLRGLRHRRLAEPPSHYSIVPFVPQQPGAEGHLAWLQAILARGGKSGNRRVLGRTVCHDGHAGDCWRVSMNAARGAESAAIWLNRVAGLALSTRGV
jgi:hypothetical protein